jgi:hypothetical protein
VYAFTQDVPIGQETYWRIIDGIGPEPIAGSLAHLCVKRPDGSLYYIDVWEDEASCARAFDERIHPAVDTAFGGNRPDTEPTVHPIDVIHLTVGPVSQPAA